MSIVGIFPGCTMNSQTISKGGWVALFRIIVFIHEFLISYRERASERYGIKNS